MSGTPRLELDASERALVEVGAQLRELGYRFTTVTPETHRRNNARTSAQEARSLRDVFGWSRAFASDTLPLALLDALRRAETTVMRRHGARPRRAVSDRFPRRVGRRRIGAHRLVKQQREAVADAAEPWSPETSEKPGWRRLLRCHVAATLGQITPDHGRHARRNR